MRVDGVNVARVDCAMYAGVGRVRNVLVECVMLAHTDGSIDVVMDGATNALMDGAIRALTGGAMDAVIHSCIVMLPVGALGRC